MIPLVINRKNFASYNPNIKFKKHALVGCRLLIFQSNDDSVINQGDIIHTGTYTCMYLFGGLQLICPLFVYFLWKKRKQCCAKVLKDVFNRSNDVY